MDRIDKYLGCMFGMALGDAYGAPTEFMSIEEILKRWPPSGPERPYGYPIRRISRHASPTEIAQYEAELLGQIDHTIQVTDDTQMAIAVGKALKSLATQPTFDVQRFEPWLRKEFDRWYVSPENNRAPGNTCLRACQRLLEGLDWWDATVINSKGCGANMRVPPVGLWRVDVPGTERERSGLAQFQAAITHGHPTGLAASDLTARAITALIQGLPPTGLLSHLLAHAREQQHVYHHQWLGPLWQRPGVDSPEDFIARGWQENIHALERVEWALEHWDGTQEPCLMTGAGWIAEEALASALFCFLVHPDSPQAVLKRASVSSGDSDSIACLAGAFAGAIHGIEAWPTEWVKHIEYKEDLEEIAQVLSVEEKN